jgi:outer membrane scaffolding protein for murein synthesis (MipA/OmpV family)
MKLIAAALFAFGMMVPLAAFAELSQDTIAGPGLRTRPAYDGSESQRGELVPVIRYLGRPWFVRSTQGVLEGGVRWEVAPGLNVGAQLAYEPGRYDRESDFLRNHGVPDVDRGASVGVHLEWDHKLGRMPITLLARARRHTDTDRGTQADFRLSAGVFQQGRFGAGVFTQATWANSKSANSFYGITPALSGPTRLPAMDPGSGWLYGSVGFLWSFDISKDWVAVGNLEVRRLGGEVAGSPLVERRSNYYAAAGIAYRF